MKPDNIEWFTQVIGDLPSDDRCRESDARLQQLLDAERALARLATLPRSVSFANNATQHCCGWASCVGIFIDTH